MSEVRGASWPLKALVIGFIVIQLTIPIVSLLGPRPSRLGWQMFSDLAPLPAVWVEDAEGELLSVDLDTLLAYDRPEADLQPAVVRALCQRPGVIAVVFSTGADTTRAAC